MAQCFISLSTILWRGHNFILRREIFMGISFMPFIHWQSYVLWDLVHPALQPDILHNLRLFPLYTNVSTILFSQQSWLKEASSRSLVDIFSSVPRVVILYSLGKEVVPKHFQASSPATFLPLPYTHLKWFWCLCLFSYLSHPPSPHLWVSPTEKLRCTF